MMRTVDNLKAVGCSVDDVLFSGSPLMEALSSFGAPEYAIFPGFLPR